MNQEDFFGQLVRGEMPARYADDYDHFLEHIMSDHLIHLSFGCGCWRFIEVKARYMGRGALQRQPGILTPGTKTEYSFIYMFPSVNVECGARIVKDEWLTRKLKVFPIQLGYRHNYADWIFKQQAEKMQREIANQPPPLVNVPTL